MHKLKLHGFNNLTKSLSFCIYDICYAKTADDRDGYIAYIDEQYNANRLTGSERDLLNHRRQYSEHRASGLRAAGRQRHHPGQRRADRSKRRRYVGTPRTAAEHGRRAPGQEPHLRTHLPGKPSGRRTVHLSRRYRSLDLRRHFAPQGAELLNSPAGIRHRHHGLPRARFHPRRERRETLHRS